MTQEERGIEHNKVDLDDLEVVSPSSESIDDGTEKNRKESTETVVVTFGTFDLLHIGHVNIIRRARKYGDKLYVGVSSDALNYSKKQKYPIYSETERMAIISNLKGVTGVFLEESLEKKREYLMQHKADVLVMGNDWEGKFDYLSDICKVVYLPRTENVSTTETIEAISGATETS